MTRRRRTPRREVRDTLLLRVRFRDGGSLGPGRARLLEQLNKTGSISAAARSLGMSYRRAWLLIDAMNGTFRQPVVRASAGGRGGGGAQVTPFGLAVVAGYREMERKTFRAVKGDLAKLHRPT